MSAPIFADKVTLGGAAVPPKYSVIEYPNWPQEEKQMKSLSIASLLAVPLSLSAAALSADTIDFTVCDGLTGAEWGICRAGVAAGCADNSGSANSCDQIESTYESVAGSPPPWIEPPVECPCDFSLVPKDLNSWRVSDDNYVIFACPISDDGIRNILVQPYSIFDAGITVIFSFSTESHLADYCEARDNSTYLAQASNLTPEEREACAASGIAYGQALKAELGDLVDDRCTPTL